jgi:hypothetical protein
MVLFRPVFEKNGFFSGPAYGGITDSWEQGTPAQRPKGAIAFGGDNGESNPRVTMRRGERTMIFLGPDGTIATPIRDRAPEVEDYVEQD